MKEVFGRFSVHKDWPLQGFARYQEYGGHQADWKITVNGIEIPQVISADTVAGEVTANELNEHGRAFVRDDAVAVREITGEVRIFVSWASES
jgi:hypothetical protein